MLAFAYRNWEGLVPDPGDLRPDDLQLLETVESGFTSVAAEMEAVHLRSALGEALRLSAEVNKYLDKTAPWFEIKQDRAAAAKSVYTALRAIDSLKTLFAPFIPFSSERLNLFLGYTEPLFGLQTIENRHDRLGEHTVLRYQPGPVEFQWQPSQLKPGQNLRQPEPLFKKLEPSVAEEERARLG